MSASSFSALAIHPENTGGESIPMLSEIVRQFPYCQSAQLLLARSMKKAGSIHFGSQIKLASAHLPDRRVLRDLVRSLTPEEKISVREVKQVVGQAETASSPVKIPPAPESKIPEIMAPPVEKKQPAGLAAVPLPEPVREEFHSFTEWLRISGEKRKKKPLLPGSQEEIINRFIEGEPKLSPPRAEFFSPVNMAKQSIMEHDDLVSETLAKIYLEQGNPHKSIQTYEKLCLIYPEKKLYFAARIEAVKQSLTDK